MQIDPQLNHIYTFDNFIEGIATGSPGGREKPWPKSQDPVLSIHWFFMAV